MSFDKTTVFAGVSLLAVSSLFAVGDPDFERTNPQELPLWSGAQWAKSSTLKYSAKVIENAKSAASGKRFLQIDSVHKRAVWVMAYPPVRFIDGFGYEATFKVRGKGKFNAGFNIYGKDGKILPILLRNGDKVEEHRDCIAVSGYGLSVFDTPGKIYHKLTAVTGFHPISQTGNAVRFSVLLDCESGLQLAFQEDKKEGDCSSNLNILLPKDCRRVFFIVTGGNACTSALWCDAVIEK